MTGDLSSAMVPRMEKPLVHLNGTSGEVLLEGYIAAGVKLRAALAALDDVAPNARDYYPLGEASYSAARREHEQRALRVRSVLQEIYEIAEHVADAMEGRGR